MFGRLRDPKESRFLCLGALGLPAKAASTVNDFSYQVLSAKKKRWKVRCVYKSHTLKDVFFFSASNRV